MTDLRAIGADGAPVDVQIAPQGLSGARIAVMALITFLVVVIAVLVYRLVNAIDLTVRTIRADVKIAKSVAAAVGGPAVASAKSDVAQIETGVQNMPAQICAASTQGLTFEQSILVNYLKNEVGCPPAS